MVDFSKLKKNRGTNLAALTSKLETMNKGSGGQKDDRIFKPGFDKSEGKGYAVIRFLPAKEGEPFVRVFNHSFKGAGGWYIETSRASIGEDDPVAIANGLYWRKGEAEGNEALKNVARGRKRNTKYYANIYVIKDTVNPANEGREMIYEFGPQIFKMIEAAAKPEFEDDQPLDPFDMWDGADFKIKIVGKEIPDGRTGNKVVVPNYENSEFARPSEFCDGDDGKKEEIFGRTVDLSEFVKVKGFDELAERFKKVTGESYNALEAGDPSDAVATRLEKETQLEREQEASPEPSKEKAKAAIQESEEEPSSGSEEEDDVLSMFRALANKS